MSKGKPQQRAAGNRAKVIKSKSGKRKGKKSTAGASAHHAGRSQSSVHHRSTTARRTVKVKPQEPIDLTQGGGSITRHEEKSRTMPQPSLSLEATNCMEQLHRNLGTLSQIITTNHIQVALTRKQIDFLSQIVNFLHLFVYRPEGGRAGNPLPYSFITGTSQFYQQGIYFALYASRRYPSILTFLDESLEEDVVYNSFLTDHQVGDVVFRVTGSSTNRPLSVFSKYYGYRLPQQHPQGVDGWEQYLNTFMMINQYGGEYNNQNNTVVFPSPQASVYFYQNFCIYMPFYAQVLMNQRLNFYALEYPNERKIVTHFMIQRFFSIRDSLKRDRSLDHNESLYNSINSKDPYGERLSLDEQAYLVYLADSLIDQFETQRERQSQQPLEFWAEGGHSLAGVINLLRNWSKHYPFILGDFPAYQNLLLRSLTNFLPRCLEGESYICKEGSLKGEYVKVSNLFYVLAAELVNNDYTAQQTFETDPSLLQRQRTEIIQQILPQCGLLESKQLEDLVIMQGETFYIKLSTFNQMDEVYRAFVSYNEQRGLMSETVASSSFSLRQLGGVASVTFNGERKFISLKHLDLSTSLRLMKVEFPRIYMKLKNDKPLSETRLGRLCEIFLNGVAIDFPEKYSGEVEFLNYIFTTKDKLSKARLSETLSRDIKNYGDRLKTDLFLDNVVDNLKGILFSPHYVLSLKKAMRSTYPEVEESLIMNRIYSNLALVLLKDIFSNSASMLEKKAILTHTKNNAFCYNSVVASFAMMLETDNYFEQSSVAIDYCNKIARLSNKAIYSIMDNFSPGVETLLEIIQRASDAGKNSNFFKRVYGLLSMKPKSSLYKKRMPMQECCTVAVLNEFIEMFRQPVPFDTKKFGPKMKLFLVSLQVMLELVRHTFRFSLATKTGFDAQGFLSRFYLVSLSIDKLHSCLTRKDHHRMVESSLPSATDPDLSWLESSSYDLTESEHREMCTINSERLYSDDEGIAIVFSRDAFNSSFFSRVSSVVDAMETGVAPSSVAKFFAPSQLKGVVFDKAFTPLDVAQVGVAPD